MQMWEGMVQTTSQQLFKQQDELESNILKRVETIYNENMAKEKDENSKVVDQETKNNMNTLMKQEIMKKMINKKKFNLEKKLTIAR